MTAAARLLIAVRGELASMAEVRALRVAAFAYVAALTIFAFGWGDTNTFARAQRCDAWLLAAVLPWIAARCVPAADGRDPSARVVALSTTLLTVVATGLPVLLFAARVAAAGRSELLQAIGVQCGIALLAAVAVTAALRMLTSPVRAWLAAAVITFAAAILMVGR